ncbi:hypothetical protein [Streptomyces synnematoformans]|uniref:Type II toxin-antitoxin system VapB family antitoxin n=1 Tax=Streptomyces synnematoformans TaxID=415721 RepID=A0ABP5KEJ5_9ACTN
MDPDTDKLISQGAHFLGMTKKDLVGEAVRAYLEQRREDLRLGMVEAISAGRVAEGRRDDADWAERQGH